MRTKSLFEEYFHALLGVIFLAVAILGKAGGLSGFNAVIIGAWVTAFIWFASQLKGYLAEKSKTANGKTLAQQAEEQAKAKAEAPKGPLALPPGMKPMIGPQWPVKAGPRPQRPGLPRQNRAPATPAALGATGTQGGAAPRKPSDPKKQTFVYERPTLPDRKPKLPHNWPKPDSKKPKQ